MFGGSFALKATSNAFGKESFFVDVDKGGGMAVLEVGLEALPTFDVSVTGGNGASCPLVAVGC